MTQRGKILLFGELLARYTTPGHSRFVQTRAWDITFTGGEANAGLVLADLGHLPRLLSAVPSHAVGQACLNYMRQYGLSVEHVLRVPASRLGILYVELGAGHRASQVIYDRQASAFAQLKPGDIDWSTALQGVDFLHFTGTAPALGDNMAALTLEGCQAAQSRGIRVCCDVSYRSALWSIAAARRVMQQIVPHLDVLIVNEEHAREILDVECSDSEQFDLYDAARYAPAMSQLAEKYQLSHVAFTIRSGETSDQTSIAAALWQAGTVAMSRRYDVPVVDRIGAGDALSGALLAAILEQQPPAACIDFAVAASCLKHSVPGDFGHTSRHEIESLLAGQSAGRVIR